MKARLSLGKNLMNVPAQRAYVIKTGSDTAILRIEIDLSRENVTLQKDGDYTSPSQERFFRDAALGESLEFVVTTVEATRIDEKSPCELSIVGTLGTKVPHTPG